MPTSFGKVFYQAIADAGMSANQFAKKVKTSSGYLSGIYSGGRTPPLKRVAIWADLLGLRGDDRIRFLALAELQHCPPAVQRYLFIEWDGPKFTNTKAMKILVDG